MAPSGLGMIHGGVRWKTDSCFTRAAMVGTIWMALAPVPTTPTFLPSSGYASSQRAEWNILPSNEASPGMSGSEGRLSGPQPGTSTRARSFLPSPVSTSHTPVRSSKRAPVTLVVEPDVRADAVLVGAVPQVRQDLLLLREIARPFRPRLEGERVQVRLHVASGPGIVVVAPGAPDLARLLQHDEIVDAGLLEPDGHSKAREAGAHNHDPMVRHQGHLTDSSPSK